MGLRGFHIRVHEMCEACVWIQNLGFLEGGRAEKVQVLGRYKYSDVPLGAWAPTTPKTPSNSDGAQKG